MTDRGSIPRRFAPILTALLASPTLLLPHSALSQEAEATSQRLQLFLDCNARNCSFDHFRREIEWVDWVRDREDAELHVLVTSQQTGAGGRRYTVDYIGRQDFEGIDKSLVYDSDPDATDAEVRDALTGLIAVGLVQYVENSRLAPQLRIIREVPDVEQAPMDVAADPWNLWVFRIGVFGSVERESQERFYELDAVASAERVAEDFKVELGAEIEYEREEFDELSDGETFINTVVDYETEALAVWSLGERLSAGAVVDAEKSTFRNQDIQISGGPAIEYNLFPWSESTRRAIVVRYAIQLAYFNYEFETIEGQREELLPRHGMEIAAAVQQPWGEVFGRVEGIQYLHDLATHRIDTFLSVEYRLFRGFGIDLFASFDRIKDQFFLSGKELTPEEILVRRRQRETGFRFEVGLGLTYRFGSRFANIVNPRLD